MNIREFCKKDVKEMIGIWNEIVEDGIAFPQEDILNLKSGNDFFSSQTYTGVAVLDEKIVGLYILHPNNVGRCSHIANASYAVSSAMRGKHIGEKLVLDSMEVAKAEGFLILQYNAVVETNLAARHLYEKLGFKQLGVIPKGFRTKDNSLENICPYYIEL
ncbi:MAG: GNAT family N-acetyltransferase [Methanobrevibacter sp.]|nr:GNAT family N-acetyltransferase [Methanobrevibacter sp.]